MLRLFSAARYDFIDACWFFSSHNNVFRFQRIMEKRPQCFQPTLPQEPTASAPTSIPDSLKDFLKLHPVNVSSTSLLQVVLSLILCDWVTATPVFVWLYTSFSPIYSLFRWRLICSWLAMWHWENTLQLSCITSLKYVLHFNYMHEQLIYWTFTLLVACGQAVCGVCFAVSVSS